MPIQKKIIKKLKAVVGEGHVNTSHEELLCYSYDGTGLEFMPEAVVFPGSAGEVSAIMKIAHAETIPVVPRGAGSGMTGGALSVAGGIVLATSRLNRILEIDKENQIALVEPGVITGRFQEEVKKAGLFYPPDPASFKFCTMGGNVAECAGGPSAVKYGVTRDYVLGLEAVLADGRIIQTGVRTAKGVVGYDLTRLLVGSEGTLGIITKITVRLLPLPEAKRTLLVLCEGMAEAVSLVTRILAKQTPCTLEYMDRTALSIVSDKLPPSLPEKAGAALIIEVDGDTSSVEEQEKKLHRFLQAQQAATTVLRATGDEESDSLWAARRALSPASYSLRPHKLNEDVVVPRSRIPDLVTFAEELSRETGTVIFTFGHAGDGNIHVNIMYDKENSLEASLASEAKKRILEHVITLGGTLSGEHGVGITKADYLPLEISRDTMELMANIKKLFDPKSILNPGKIFPFPP